MKVHYSSNKHTWETPQDFFDKLNKLFNFTLDACALVVFSDKIYNLDSFGYCI